MTQKKGDINKATDYLVLDTTLNGTVVRGDVMYHDATGWVKADNGKEGPYRMAMSDGVATDVIGALLKGVVTAEAEADNIAEGVNVVAGATAGKVQAWVAELFDEIVGQSIIASSTVETVPVVEILM